MPKTTEVLKILNQNYKDLPIPLKHGSPFELLIAVILSAQCTDERVNTITPLLPKTAKGILNLGEDEVRRIIRPCGYFNSKTTAIMGCALALPNSKVPSDFKELTALPGVGPKTAQVIQSQAFGMDAFPVDTHVHRVCNRLGLANSGKNRNLTEHQVKASVPKNQWSRLHLQLIYHGRRICTARKPKCKQCPLLKVCEWPIVFS